VLIDQIRKEFCRPPNPQAEHLRCVAHLESDISEVFPYLNTVLVGHQFFLDPPSLTLKLPGKLVTLYPKEIAINILKDEAEADEVLEWLKGQVNETWRRRQEIKPSFAATAKPRVIEILKLLPKSNCGACDHPTCMVYAVKVSERAAEPQDCRALDEAARTRIEEYLQQFHAGQ
jgi:ArsR family metal-binding transcriptional regulator